MQNRNILIFTMIAMVTSSFFLSNSYAQLSKTNISMGDNQVPPSIANDTPGVCTEIPDNDYLWRIKSDHFPLQAGDRMIITMFKNGIQVDSCNGYKRTGGYDDFREWSGKTLSIQSVDSDDGGYYELLNSKNGTSISCITLHVFSELSQDYSDACEAPGLKFYTRDCNVWSVNKNFSQEHQDVIEIGPQNASLPPVLYSYLEKAGTLSFTLGHSNTFGEFMECTFRIIDKVKPDTILTYKVGTESYKANFSRRFTFYVDRGNYLIEWQRLHHLTKRERYETSFLDSIIFTPDQDVATSSPKNHHNPMTLQQNSLNNTFFDISGRTIQKFTHNKVRSNMSTRFLINAKRND